MVKLSTAIISDIHGNLPALEAVLADIKARKIDHTVCLGDLVGKGPSPAEVVDLVRDSCNAVIQGNWDDMVLNHSGTEMWDFYRQRLGAERLAYLSTLPFSVDMTLSGRLIRLYHASAQSIYHRVHPWSDIEERRAMFENSPSTKVDPEHRRPDVVGYGDIHHSFLQYFEGKTLFNVGSVGNPLDVPLASYVVLEGVPNTSDMDVFNIQFVRVPYDIDRAVQDAKTASMPLLAEYERELRTARYRGSKS